MISVLAFSFGCLSIYLLVCLMATMDRLRIERSMLSIEKAKSEKLKKDDFGNENKSSYCKV